jgi:hypothetical protein
VAGRVIRSRRYDIAVVTSYRFVVVASDTGVTSSQRVRRPGRSPAEARGRQGALRGDLGPATRETTCAAGGCGVILE